MIRSDSFPKAVSDYGNLPVTGITLSVAGSGAVMIDDTEPDWRAEGACVTADPDLFFPFADGAHGARQANQARRICARCVVRSQCLQFAMSVPEAHGSWGGTTPAERRRERDRRHARGVASGLAAS